MLIENPKAVEKAIWRYLDAYSSPCRGDITRGWDWRTLRIIFPQISSVLHEAQRLQLEANKS